MNWDHKKIKIGINKSRRIANHYGKSYYFSTQMFPKTMKQATYVLYAFFRLPDEIVDNSHDISPQIIDQKLQQWSKEWNKAYRHQKSDNEVLYAASYIFHTYSIPYKYSQDFIRAMLTDVTKNRYKNYEELEQYMYGSASVVGLMMTHIIGFNHKKALLYAEQLGKAMQLTNFLRDIAEDYDQRDRIYMPLDELAHFGISEDDIHHKRFSPAFKQFMQFQIRRTRELYNSSRKGIPLLDKKGQNAITLASSVYGAILDKIEQQDCNVFTKRAATTISEKLLLLLKLYV